MMLGKRFEYGVMHCKVQFVQIYKATEKIAYAKCSMNYKNDVQTFSNRFISLISFSRKTFIEYLFQNIKQY